jgi:hypothetical protein
VRRVTSLPHQPARPREAAIPILATLVTVGLPLVLRERLPEVVAIHWGFDGRPDGSASLMVDLVLMSAMGLLVAFLPLRLAGRAPRGSARLLVATAHAMSVLLALLRWLMVRANLDVTRWEDAGPVTGWHLLGALPVVLLAGALGWWLAKDRLEHPPSSRRVPILVTADDEVVIWIGRQSVRWATVQAPVAVSVGVVVAAVGRDAVALTIGASLVAAGVLIALLTSLAVTVGPEGLVVRLGPVGRPRIRVALEDIGEVTIEDVEPLTYGGWGYRMMPGVRAVVVRRGPGLRVTRPDRPDLVVTIDDAHVAAAVLGSHLARTRRT